MTVLASTSTSPSAAAPRGKAEGAGLVVDTVEQKYPSTTASSAANSTLSTPRNCTQEDGLVDRSCATSTVGSSCKVEDDAEQVTNSKPAALGRSSTTTSSTSSSSGTTSKNILRMVLRFPYTITNLFFLQKKFLSHRLLGFLFLVQYAAEVYLYFTDYEKFKSSILVWSVPLTGFVQSLNAALTFRFLPRKEDPGFAAVADKSVLSYYTVRENSFYAMQLLWICCYLQCPDGFWRGFYDEKVVKNLGIAPQIEIDPHAATLFSTETVPPPGGLVVLSDESSVFSMTSSVEVDTARAGSYHDVLGTGGNKFFFFQNNSFKPVFQRVFFFLLEPIFVFFVFYFRSVFWPVSRIRNAVKNAKNKSPENAWSLTASAYAIKVFYLFAKHFVSYFPNYLIFLGRITEEDRYLLYGIQVIGAYACTISIFIHTLKFKNYIGPMTAMVAYDVIIPGYFYLYWNMRHVLLRNYDLFVICGISLVLNLGPLQIWHAYHAVIAAVMIFARIRSMGGLSSGAGGRSGAGLSPVPTEVGNLFSF
ncbi:unnamed protein product [Amoebophrya sp. A120]|nr:unnamed protein product [Amoebophrya sp. A120]|eukprot:GSA120T00014460001.1